ncbi:hypothetical protein ACE6H2_008471 [Prunus campanulata]
MMYQIMEIWQYTVNLVCNDCVCKIFEYRVTAVDGRYQIGIYTARGIQYGEEIIFDYNSVSVAIPLYRMLHGFTEFLY